MPKVYLYARVSTVGQNIEAQIDDLKAAYPKARLFQEKKTGTEMENRAELHRVLDLLDEGDKLVVWSIDRLGRSNVDLANMFKLITEERKAHLHVLKQNIDTTATDAMTVSMTKCFVGMLGVFAEFETNLRKERQLIGIEKAKKEGKYTGRKNDETKRAKIKEGIALGLSVPDIQKLASCGRNTVYRVKREIAEAKADAELMVRIRSCVDDLVYPRKIAKALDVPRSKVVQIMKELGYNVK